MGADQRRDRLIKGQLTKIKTQAKKTVGADQRSENELIKGQTPNDQKTIAKRSKDNRQRIKIQRALYFGLQRAVWNAKTDKHYAGLAP